MNVLPFVMSDDKGDTQHHQTRHNEWQGKKLAEHAMLYAEVGSINMAVAHMVHALAACLLRLLPFCMDVENGEKQHRHEYRQKHP